MGNKGKYFVHTVITLTLTIEKHDTWGQHGKESDNLQTMLTRVKLLRKKI